MFYVDDLLLIGNDAPKSTSNRKGAKKMLQDAISRHCKTLHSY